MSRMIIVDATEGVACPKCAHAFTLTEGISRQAIERHAEDFDRTLAECGSKMEAELAAQARRKAERDAAREIAKLRDAAASAQAEAPSHKVHIEKAHEQVTAARQQFDLERKDSRQRLDQKKSALAHQRSNDLALHRDLHKLEDARRLGAGETATEIRCARGAKRQEKCEGSLISEPMDRGEQTVFAAQNDVDRSRKG